MTCDTYNCKKKPVFKTKRADKVEEKYWCSLCFGIKASKYEMTAERLK